MFQWRFWIQPLKAATTFALFVCLPLIGGCSVRDTSISADKDSVVDLVDALPNLKPLEIESCQYEIKQVTEIGWVPSPSDTETERKGSIVVSESSAANLHSTFTWDRVAHAELPAALAAIVPPGDLLISSELNGTFKMNQRHPWGMMVRLDDPKSRELYFLTHDQDHPIK
jgi:hypothetical protein